MAEGWTRALKADTVEPFSAGIVAHGQNPHAVRVMAEAGVDIAGQESKTLQSFLDRGAEFDAVVTVCGHADESCPAFPGATRVVHVPFDDPPRLAKDAANEEEALRHYCRVRDEIRDYILTLPDSLEQA